MNELVWWSDLDEHTYWGVDWDTPIEPVDVGDLIPTGALMVMGTVFVAMLN